MKKFFFISISPPNRIPRNPISLYLSLLLTALWLVASSPAFGENVKALMENYHSRQIKCLQDIAAAANPSPEQSVAQILLNQDIEKANRTLLSFRGGEASLRECVLLLRLLRTCQNDPNQLLPETKQHIEKEIASYFSQYQKMLFAQENSVQLTESREIFKTSALFLWAKHVASATPDYHWPDGRSNDSHLRQSLDDAHQWLDKRGRYGFEERSSAYYVFDLGALLCLRDFCDDEILRIKSDSVIDMMLTDIAQESLDGFWGGARCRSFEAIAPLPGNRLHYIFFGHPPAEYENNIAPVTLHIASTGYVPPPAVVRLGNDWKYRGTYDVKTRYCQDRTDPENSDNGRKYSHVTPQYILGSFQLRDERAPWQTRPWDLLILDENNQGHHMFSFTGDQFFSGGAPPFHDEFYYWNATCFQYKNVLFCQFHRSDRKREFADSALMKVDERYVQLPTRVWIPDAFAPLSQENDWWFAEVGEVYLAFRPLAGKSYWWRSAHIGEEEKYNAAILSFQDLYTAFLLEVELKANFTSFAQFKKEISDSPLEIEKEWASFVSRRGDVFLFSLQGRDFMLNGVKSDPWKDSSYDLYSSPFARSVYGSGIFKVQWNPFSLELDFTDPKSPKRIFNQE